MPLALWREPLIVLGPLSGEGGLWRRMTMTLAERGIRTALLFLVTVVLARNFGPDDYGQFAAAFALYSILTGLVGLGIAGTLVRAIMRPAFESGLIRGVLVARALTAALVAMLFVPVIGYSLNFTPSLMLAVCVGLFAYTFEALEHYLQGREAFVQLAYLRLGAATLMTGLTIFVCLDGQPVALVLASRLTEWLLFLLLSVCFLRGIFEPAGASLRENLRAAGHLARHSRPILLSTFAAVLYLKLDQLMLAWLTTPADVAEYAVAAQLSEAWYVLPTTIAAVLLPTFVRLHEQSPLQYRAALQNWSDILVILAVIIAIVISFIAAPLVTLLFGADYAGAAEILEIHIWTAVFVFHRALVSKWMIVENRLALSLHTQILGLGANFVLNLLLIPRIGGLGAAIATLVAYAMAGYLGLRLWPAGREAARLFERTLLLPVRVLKHCKDLSR